MRKLLPLIGLTGVAAMAAALLLTMAALLPIGEARGGVNPGLSGGEHDAPTYTGPPGGGSDFINTGTQTVGHEQGEPRHWAPAQACIDLDAVVHLIELSHAGILAQNEFWVQMVKGGTCKDFPVGLKFWPDEVVVKMRWADGDMIWVLRGHDSTAFAFYSWLPEAHARTLNIPPSWGI